MTAEEELEWAWRQVAEYRGLAPMHATHLTVYLGESGYTRSVVFTGEEIVELSEEAIKKRIRAALDGAMS